jgi:N-acetylmuramoyl-L-alanine amidase
VEKNLALQIALRAKAVLEAQGATVILTREADVDLPLSARAMIANEADADIFLSIHCNSMATLEGRKTTQGIETYFLSPDPTDAEAKMLAEMENGGPDALPSPKSGDPVKGLLADLSLSQARNDSAELALYIQRSLVHTLRSPGRGVRQAPFLVLSALKMPAALLEIGFISHPQEGRRLSKEPYQQKAAEAIAEAVKQFTEKVLARRLEGTPKDDKAAEPASMKKTGALPAPTPAVAGLPASR